MPTRSPLRHWLAGLLLALALPASAADFELPPVDEVFVLSARATAPGRIEVEWQIAEGFYLYRHRTSATADAGFAAGPLALPPGKQHRDEFFGDVETYRTRLRGVLTGTPAPGAATTSLTIKYQGCADAGVCYPPQTRVLRVALPGGGAGGGELAGVPRSAGGLFGFGAAAPGATEAAPLPEARAFTVEAIADGGNRLLLRLTPARGYYIYRDMLGLRLEGAPGLAAALPPAAQLPRARPYRDEHFGDVAVYFDQVEIAVPVQRAHPRAATATVAVELQGCQDGGICYPPMTRRLVVALPAGAITPATAVADATPDAPASGTAAPVPPVPVSGVAPLPATGDAPGAPASPTGTAVPTAAAENPLRTLAPAAGAAAHGLLASLLLALLGGLILNLMPCVLPVLSLKALSLAQSGASRAHARRHALAYTAGVLLSFAALGALALGLRHAGLALGWGFQLQQPLVVAVLALVIFALGLSLSGVWYASLAVGQRGTGLLQGGGIRADFFTGVLAVVLATPCTAPFMGAALAYAFTGPPAAGMLVFLALGLGLALPFLLIGFVPALARRLPRPGAWMETLKQLLAFPLYATAAWLVWVLAKQRGADAAGLWMASAIALALAAWAWSRWRAGGGLRWAAVTALAVLAMAWPLPRLQLLPPAQAATGTQTNGLASVPYTEAALAGLRSQGRVVFVNMTADWCVSCKGNEKTVFARERFREALQAADAIYMVGDYTNVDPVITAYLQAHKAVGVPLYVVYPRGGGEGRVLPVLLTPGVADAALAWAADPR